MSPEEVRAALMDIELALNFCNNCVATDLVDVQPEHDKSWRIDHTKELDLIVKVQAALFGPDDRQPVCLQCYNRRWLVWRQRDKPGSERFSPLVQSCQYCNESGAIPPPIHPVSGMEAVRAAQNL